MPCSSTLPDVVSVSDFAPCGRVTRAKAASDLFLEKPRVWMRWSGLPSTENCTEPLAGCARKKSSATREPSTS